MLHPVGSQPPAVYWRRRLVVLAALVLLFVLVILTARTVLSGDGGTAAAATGNAHTTQPANDPAAARTTTPAGGVAADDPSTSTSSTHPSAPSSSGASSSAAPARCTPAQLAVKAVVGKPRYAVGDQPVLTLQVTNTGSAACVQNVADSQIVLRVYNGASRVWGSHDCQIEPGVDERTLEPGKPAGFSVVWSGLTSQPKCAGTRQRVGAGTYTLYAALSGHDGKATQFVIS
ncbi:MAG TPA: hypothetical protein VFT67_01090 [Jatrophihabitantaceae bacterium]|jgi:hypothetical protein|nr:hypothetical protein [Jatrophihabitantaceae bacterium]